MLLHTAPGAKRRDEGSDMDQSTPTLLKALLRERKWRTYERFRHEYIRVARTIGPDLDRSCPGQSTFWRWVGGQHRAPRGNDARAVLEAMFPGQTAEALFAPPVALSRPAPGDVPRMDPGDNRSTSEIGDDALANAAGESSAFLARVEATNVGELTVEQMQTDVRRISGAYLNAPPAPLFARTKALRDQSFTLLGGRQAPRQTRELYAVAGWSLTILAWMSVDLGRSDAAEDHARAAWLCAERADYHALRAWVRATQHTAAFWQGDYAKAASYAADGLTYAGSAPAAGTAALYLSSALAVDLARGGQHDAAIDALHRAQHVAESTTRAEDEVSGPLTCTYDRAESLWSDAELALGEADKALAAASNAVAAFEAAPPGLRNHGSERMTRAQQVKAHLILGDLRSAEEALEPVLETERQHRVRPLLHRLGEVSTMTLELGTATRSIRGSIAAFRRQTVDLVTRGAPDTDA